MTILPLIDSSSVQAGQGVREPGRLKAVYDKTSCGGRLVKRNVDGKKQVRLGGGGGCERRQYSRLKHNTPGCCWIRGAPGFEQVGVEPAVEVPRHVDQMRGWWWEGGS